MQQQRLPPLILCAVVEAHEEGSHSITIPYLDLRRDASRKIMRRRVRAVPLMMIDVCLATAAAKRPEEARRRADLAVSFACDVLSVKMYRMLCTNMHVRS